MRLDQVVYRCTSNSRPNSNQSYMYTAPPTGALRSIGALATLLIYLHMTMKNHRS